MDVGCVRMLVAVAGLPNKHEGEREIEREMERESDRERERARARV